MELYIAVIPVSIAIAIGLALYLIWRITRMDPGTEKMKQIHKAIRQGSHAYLKRQYKVVLAILSLITVVLYFLIDYTHNLGVPYVALSFMMGTVSSLLAGYVSMEAATRANVMAANAARRSQTKPLSIAFQGGLVLGITVVAMSLLGVAGLFYLYWAANGWRNVEKIPELIMGYGFGASLAALFAQLGGGIYTKAADVGADLVGKIEAGIPEDDPRNPATVADNVGDNVGDCAGRGADLFESISAENIGSMIIGGGLFMATQNMFFLLYPIIARAIGLIATIFGAMAVRPKENEAPIASLRKGLIVSTILIAIALYFATTQMLGPHSELLYYASLTGLIAAIAIEVVTEYYTGEHKPVKEIAEAARTGPATNIHIGLSVGMEATALPIILVLIALAASYVLGTQYGQLTGIDPHTGGVYGTVTATIGMLSLTGIILAMDGYGPIADNTGGIIEMSGVEEVSSETLDALDAAGNTTKALAKGFAMGSAAMAALLLFQAYVDIVKIDIFNLIMPSTLIGLIVGAMIPFLFSSQAIKAVGRAAQKMIDEVRRQFREIPGILEGKNPPDYAKCVEISTMAAQKEMIAPSLIILVSPIITGLLLGPIAAGAFLIGVTASGIMLAFTQNTAGAAWDNAKKILEKIGEKGSEQHKATVVGDTVGDPMKDTAGPSIHVVLKLVNNVAIVFGALFLLYALYLVP
ncbi:MAG: sodium-translocating pyrophosphatase [Nitrososphaeria archaeon]|nr:sodium-translocating pyrophosphatase [Nitrososphaeria archaeon]NIQ33010.1 sodium-translocating pyrophosphatase [Nitrososphaeria archaeon]